MTDPRTPPAPTRAAMDPSAWVEAAPFRSHLRHLCATSGLPWTVIALHAGLTLRHADTLLHGRGGRRLRRLPRPAAVRLWALTVPELLVLPQVMVPADPTSRRISSLLLDGMSLPLLCRELGWTSPRLAAVLDAEASTVSAAEALQVRALIEFWDRGRLARELCAA